MTDEVKALVERCKGHTPGPWRVDGPPHNQIVWNGPESRICFMAHSNGVDNERDIATGNLVAAAPELLDLIETQAREIERLRLDVEAQEALQVSAYRAGLKAGWNFCVSDDNAGMQAAMADTAHIKELRRIREARAALAGDSHD